MKTQGNNWLFRNALTFVVIGLIFLSGTSILNAQHMTGCIIDSVAYSKLPVVGFGMNADDDMPVFSLKKYCPTPISQGRIGSCSSWATGYAAYTIRYCYDNNITDQTEKDKNAFSALYIYNQIARYDLDCKNGTSVEENLLLLEKKGDCKYSNFNMNNCHEKPNEIHHGEAAKYKIKKGAAIFFAGELNTTNKITAIVNSLKGGTPVICSMKLPKSFDYHRTKFFNYNPSADTLEDSYHAMCVIGYDNNRRIFEIMNSWGEDWGDKGFFEISYESFARLTDYAFYMDIGRKTEPKEINANFHLLKFNVDKKEFVERPVVLNNNTYTVEGIRIDDQFKLKADSLSKDCYIYIFSLQPDGSVEIIYPMDKAFHPEAFGNSAISQIPKVISEGLSLTLPDANGGVFKSSIPGEDFLCLLYSTKPIDNIQDYVLKIKENTSKDFWIRLKSSFGKILINEKNVNYKKSLMSAKAYVEEEGYVLPIVLKANIY